MLRPSHPARIQEQFDCHCYFWLSLSTLYSGHYFACSIIRDSEKCLVDSIMLCVFKPRELSLSRSGETLVCRGYRHSLFTPPQNHISASMRLAPACQRPLQSLSFNFKRPQCVYFPCSVSRSPGCWAKCSSRLNSQQGCQISSRFCKNIFFYMQLYSATRTFHQLVVVNQFAVW